MKSLFNLFLSFILFCLLSACGKVSQENFNKIYTNMKMQEVVAILGEPTSSNSVNIAGVSGTASQWKTNEAEIDIQFLNDKVIAKTFSKSDEKSNSSNPLNR